MKIINHLIIEYEKAIKRGDQRPAWGRLLETLKLTLEDFSSSPIDLNRSYWRFFQLGQITQQLKGRTMKESGEAYSLTIEAKNRRYPIWLKNLRAQTVRGYAQCLAQIEWETRAVEKIRIGEMAEIIWAKLLDSEISKIIKQDVLKVLPDKPAGLKPWLREVAPEYAKKAGRPPNK
jgi:hypothetical protein